MLRTPKTFGDIARVGPIKRQADTIYDFITDPRPDRRSAPSRGRRRCRSTRRSTCSATCSEELGMKLDRVFMNGLYPQLFTDDEAATLRERARARRAATEPAASAACAGPPCGQRSRSTAARPPHARAAERLRGGVAARTWSSCRSCSAPQLDMEAVERARRRDRGAAACERRATLLEDKQICICAGSGGVGKTTTSAAIAMGMAAAGQEGRGADDRPGEAARELARAAGARQRGAARRPGALCRRTASR